MKHKPHTNNTEIVLNRRAKSTPSEEVLPASPATAVPLEPPKKTVIYNIGKYVNEFLKVYEPHERKRFYTWLKKQGLGGIMPTELAVQQGHAEWVTHTKTGRKWICWTQEGIHKLYAEYVVERVMAATPMYWPE